MNYYERHIGDYIRDTVKLSMIEDGAYNRLIDQYYQTERPLPEDKKMLYRLARASTSAERKAVDFVMETFFILEAGHGYRQKRIEAEISRYLEKKAKAKASADARWNKLKQDANAYDEGMRTHSEGNAHQTPDTRHHLKPSLSGAAPVDNSGLDDRVEIDGLTDYHKPDWKPDLARVEYDLATRAGIPLPDPIALQLAIDKFNLTWQGKALTLSDTYARLRIWLTEDYRRGQTQNRANPAAPSGKQRQETPVERTIRENRQFLADHGIDPDDPPVRE